MLSQWSQTVINPLADRIGLINVRKLPLPHPDTTPNKRGIILRSGETARLTDLGKFQLRNLGITKIFDLRSAREIKRIQSPLQVEGIEVVHAPAMPLSRSENMQDVFVKFKYDEGEDPDAQFVVSYDDILKEAVAAFRLIFEHIRDRLPLGEGMLIHCTGGSSHKLSVVTRTDRIGDPAGKDRTGVAVMLILGVRSLQFNHPKYWLNFLLIQLIRLDRQTIAREYALTRIGLESGRESLLSRYKHILTNPETSQAACNVFSSRWVDGELLLDVAY